MTLPPIEDFVRALAGGVDVAPSSAAADEIAEVWGVRPSPALARLVSVLASDDVGEPSLGEFFAFGPEDWLPGKRNAFEMMLGEWFRRNALLTGTLPLGATGAGDIWLVELEPRAGHHRVFLLDHDLGAVHVVADSLESFAWLCHACESPPDEWDVVAGRVRGWSDLDVPVTQLPEDERMTARRTAVRELLAALWHGPRFEVAAGNEEGRDVAAVITRMLRSFLREEDDALLLLLEDARRHPARILKDAARSLAPKLAIHGYEARLRSLGTVEDA